ncbi:MULTISPECIES: helix-turn-helix domain-containing protein [unclassified Pseudomonas]|uniref:helix-turn-helix domain-containing protein n=1 Tax=unclassified Pseudomonas TaxID=196821 RepID=UPI002E80EB0A|nr:MULTISPECIES: helix-turn-helix transcriptional regulator [unclassified Pseudomonas]
MDLIGQRLKEERIRLGRTQRDFAAVGGVLPNAQSNYERGLRSPSAFYLAKLAKVGVDVLYVVTAERGTRGRGVGSPRHSASCLPMSAVSLLI